MDFHTSGDFWLTSSVKSMTSAADADADAAAAAAAAAGVSVVAVLLVDI